MKEVMCCLCKDKRFVDDNIILAMCYCCQTEMKEIEE